MTKTKNFIVGAAAAAFLPFAFLALSGCETESVSSVTLTISPSHAELAPGESVTFTASGGWDYQWSLETPTAGHLDKSTGSKVTYTATQGGTNETTAVTQKLTVTGMGGSTNAANASATVYITQKSGE